MASVPCSPISPSPALYVLIHSMMCISMQYMHFNCPLCSRESKVGVAKKILVLQKKFGPLSLALKSVAVKDEKCHSQQALNCLLDHVCSTGLAYYSTAHTQLDNARESRSIPVRVSPACSRVSPAWSRVSPAWSRVSPACSRVSPACSRVSPACNRVSPACSRVSPACNRVSLACSRVSPRAYDFELPVVYISTKRISQYL